MQETYIILVEIAQMVKKKQEKLKYLFGGFIKNGKRDGALDIRHAFR